MSQPTNTNWYANALANSGALLTPFARQFGSNVPPANPNSTSARNAASWRQAASNNGAGPVANNVSSPWTFNDFITGNRPLSSMNPQGISTTGSAKTGGMRFPWLLAGIVGVLVYLIFFRR